MRRRQYRLVSPDGAVGKAANLPPDKSFLRLWRLHRLRKNMCKVWRRHLGCRVRCLHCEQCACVHTYTCTCACLWILILVCVHLLPFVVCVSVLQRRGSILRVVRPWKMFASGASKNVFGTMHFRTMLLVVEVWIHIVCTPGHYLLLQLLCRPCIQDTLAHLNLALNKARGQYYDGASTMRSLNYMLL